MERVPWRWAAAGAGILAVVLASQFLPSWGYYALLSILFTGGWIYGSGRRNPQAHWLLLGALAWAALAVGHLPTR